MAFPDPLADVGRCGPVVPQEIMAPSRRSASFAIEVHVPLYATWGKTTDVQELEIGHLTIWAQCDAEWCPDDNRWGAHVRAWTTAENGGLDVSDSDIWDHIKGSLVHYESSEWFRFELQRHADRADWW